MQIQNQRVSLSGRIFFQLKKKNPRIKNFFATDMDKIIEKQNKMQEKLDEIYSGQEKIKEKLKD